MATETILALLTTISLLAAGTAWVFAWRINQQWSDFTAKMNDEWFKLYQTISEKNATENRESE